jgi:hypothetical protein
MNENTHSVDEPFFDALDCPLPDDVERRLRARLAEFRNKVTSGLPAPEPRRKRRIRLWLGAAASAAAILLAAMLVVAFRPQVSFAEMISAMKQLPWIHVTITDNDGAVREVWYSPAKDVSASRSDDWIEYFDHKLRVYHSYDVSERVVYRVPEYTPRRSSRYASMAESLRTLLQGGQLNADPLPRMPFLEWNRSKPELLKQSLTRVEEQGRQSLDYQLTIRYSQVPDPVRIRFLVDPETKLPRLCRVEGRFDGNEFTSEKRFDYPERGPADVFEIGAPKSARLIDRVPSDDIVRIQETLRAGRQRMDDYRAIVVSRTDDPDYMWWINERPMILYRKGDKTRVDVAGGKGVAPRFEKPADDADLEKWWRTNSEKFHYYPLYITDGSTSFNVESELKRDNETERLVVSSVKRSVSNQLPGENYPPYWSRSPEYVCRPPLGIPRQDFEAVLEMKPEGGPAGAILLRVRRTGRMPTAPNPDAGKLPPAPDLYRNWLDPARDYVVLRHEMLTGEAGKEVIQGSTVVEELNRSPGGTWYASRFRIKAVPPVAHDELFNVYIDFHVELPDSLFEPPSVGDELL